MDTNRKSENSNEPGSSEGSATRWWEFYAVRYAMGTVVGAVVLYSLCLSTPVFKPLLFDTATSGTATKAPDSSTLAPIKLETVQLALLATYGLIYCYIASAPILVFHASRFLLSLDVNWQVWLRRCLTYLLIPLAAALGICLESGSLPFVERAFFSVVGFLFTFVLWFQYCAVGLGLLKRKELYAFYKRLSQHRASAKGGITDSYRHLREHGNSFFIVFLEIILGIILVGVGRLSASKYSSDKGVYLYIALMLVWILPAAFVWLVATVFEREFAE